MAKSKFTLNDIGIIAERRSTKRKKVISAFPTKPERATIPKLRRIMKMNKNLLKRLISISNFPTLVSGAFEFIYALVSIPVNTIIPKI